MAETELPTFIRTPITHESDNDEIYSSDVFPPQLLIAQILNHYDSGICQQQRANKACSVTFSWSRRASCTPHESAAASARLTVCALSTILTIQRIRFSAYTVCVRRQQLLRSKKRIDQLAPVKVTKCWHTSPRDKRRTWYLNRPTQLGFLKLRSQHIRLFYRHRASASTASVAWTTTPANGDRATLPP